ncbi:MAG TPA: response regulator [Vicinamibacterales bacterium]|nr:response regulator [Vicinamibacterales bacterium]
MRPRLLLIDDNLTQLYLYTFLLQHDADMLTASRGEDGFALACRQRPDAVVVDAVMPGLDGFGVCERLLANRETASLPLIVLTGDEAAYARATAMRGVDAVLKKPCPDLLLRAVLQAISIRTIR